MSAAAILVLDLVEQLAHLRRGAWFLANDYDFTNAETPEGWLAWRQYVAPVLDDADRVRRRLAEAWFLLSSRVPTPTKLRTRADRTLVQLVPSAIEVGTGRDLVGRHAPAELIRAREQFEEAVRSCVELQDALIDVVPHLRPPKPRRRKPRRPDTCEQKPLTAIETRTLETVSRHRGNYAAAAFELRRNPKTVRENYERAHRKLARMMGPDSRSVRAKALPTDHRGQPRVHTRGG